MQLDFDAIFLNDLDWSMVGSIILRTLIMFTVILLFLRLSGKKGIRQLSIFEVAIIIGLGSAAGDPMFNENNAILPSLIVFTIILLFYRLITWLAAKSERFEALLEGNPIYIIEEGMFTLIEEHEQTYAKDEFFAELRQQNIEHLGQVQTALLETNGQVSFFYYGDDQVKPGLPVLPRVYQKKSAVIKEPGQYACTSCGLVVEQEPGRPHCPRCHQGEWVRAIQTLRRT